MFWISGSKFWLHIRYLLGYWCLIPPKINWIGSLMVKSWKWSLYKSSLGQCNVEDSNVDLVLRTSNVNGYKEEMSVYSTVDGNYFEKVVKEELTQTRIPKVGYATKSRSRVLYILMYLLVPWPLKYTYIAMYQIPVLSCDSIPLDCAKQDSTTIQPRFPGKLAQSLDTFIKVLHMVSILRDKHLHTRFY